MLNKPVTCPKCEGQTQEGFVMDRAHGGGVVVSRWVAGIPVSSIWTGTKVGDKQQYPIQSFRCSRCGYLESYANDQAGE